MFLRPSLWEYETSASGGIGAGLVALAGGSIYLKSPTGVVQQFRFGGLGVGRSFGRKLLQLPELNIGGTTVAGASSTKEFKSIGLVLRSSQRTKGELTRGDFRGGILFVEFGWGTIAGVSGDAMLFGINPLLLDLAISEPEIPLLLYEAVRTAAGAILFCGVNLGLQNGFAIAGLVGYML